MPDPRHAVDQHRLLRALVDELARCGLREACTSPGSRNTPIVLSLVRDPRLRCFSHIDERCAGFFAVGAARASGRPVAVTCTSGTAAAELMPAVVEAHWGRVPLIVLTADRPAELREVGAGQAIDQIKLYGDHAKWFCEVEPPPALDAAAMRWVRQLACRAYWTALEGPPGPVHLNLPLREPLILSEPIDDEAAELAGRPDGQPWVARLAPRAPAPPRAVTSLPARTVLVAGRVEDDERTSAEIGAFAERLGVPVLADPLSSARSGTTAIATYDLLLRDATLGERLTPEHVIRIGDLPTSKPLRTWLASLPSSVEQTLVDPCASWQDPAGVIGRIWPGRPEALLRALEGATDPAWLAAWRAADDAAGQALTGALTARPLLSEPLVARRLGEWLDPAVTLFVASSMPIRDVELYLPARTPLPRVLSNRGANGIDGTISAAFGAAAADPGRPVVLLIGDVALLHDLGGLLAARRLGLELTIVALNNDGGGIFHFLPVSGEGAAFEEHIATPHGLSLERAAALFELTYARAETEDELRG
ncbi:MAG TPA: 2-succinyl-5-enolpyruvyl-6-hydroxy-3-cyclohexene-1-carboxylic-acid synthase, partial [Solirubrobacteraceae bacterium]|nr:2-succinyl-5-enolpyruvyl-6-hydroxy-3-cyclohexene-1-carboxylic-acid synthase [Solirubrobacteraceae bacterium]